ncbi:aminoglycoside 6-adenylyltransferase [Paenibacillus flagellatus]|uniref:Aminoglycoside adenylyltransferase n=1 Tax=Paenibacillus flagellatus TaxID=2211139 RepID=A0A2V5JVF2_9BACL|nr:aminoglycoside 6-adenylyltransferase [Paenibacillus flagellatus]PYI50568.1 aminoglycoside adenylyltransferase [Paenibacillus flagellatus]
MRTEQEMMDLFLNYAKGNERIRAVTLEGSRTNPYAPKDWLQDFDISYHVTDMDAFIGNPSWIDAFGERILLQTPEDMAMFPAELGRRFSYLMLFADGRKADLTLIPLDEAEEYVKEDKLMTVLLDKDGVFPEVPPPTDEDYRVKRPSAEFFADCCNEFWMVSTYVAKGLWRREILYAIDHLNQIFRPMLLKMIEWKVGLDTDCSVSIGKNGKYLERFMTGPDWRKLLSTYRNETYEDVWNAMFTAIELFRATAREVAERMGFDYPEEDDRRVSAYLMRVRDLAPDATELI